MIEASVHYEAISTPRMLQQQKGLRQIALEPMQVAWADVRAAPRFAADPQLPCSPLRRSAKTAGSGSWVAALKSRS